MEATPPPLGVAAASPTPPPAWAGAAQWTAPDSVRPVRKAPAPPAWPRSAQWATGALLLLAVGLLAWHAAGTLRWGSRPTTLEPDAALAYRIDLNRADRAQLRQLPGVGEDLARRIEAYRQEHHGFRRVEDLRNVRGIGPAMLEKLRPVVCVEPPEGEDEIEPARPVVESSPAGVKKERPLPGGRKKKLGPGERIDINRASAEELRRLPQVGPVLAAAIIRTRAERPFRSADDLMRVPGIKAGRLKALRPYLTVGGKPEQVVREE